MQRSKVVAAVALVVSSSASLSFGQTAYFSAQGDFTAGSSLQDFFINTSRLITSSETLRFETFSSRGTANAAGDTSPTIAHNFDSNLTLTNQFGGAGPFSNDDGAAPGFLDSNLTWASPSAPNNGGNLGTSLSSSLFRLRLNEFDNETGPWGVDLVGPANAMGFSGFSTPQGNSTVRSIKFGTNAAADINAPANQHARFEHVTNATYTITGEFVIGQTGNATYFSNTNAELIVNGMTTVRRGGDINLTAFSGINANGGLTVDGGRVVIDGSRGITVGTTVQFADITNGGRMDVNANRTFNALGARLDLGFSSNATENVLAVNGGIVNTRGSSIGESTGSVGRATISGVSGRWNMTEFLTVGGGGQGTLEVTTGAQVTNVDGVVARDSGSTGTVNVTGNGSIWTNTGNLTLGRSTGGSTANVTIGAGGRLNVGDTASTNNVDGFSFIEDQGPTSNDGGVLTVFAGGTLNNTATGGNSGLSVGRGTGRRGSVVVSGTGATINDNLTFIGFQGTGTLSINGGGKYIANGAFLATSGGTATVTIDGASSQLWSKGDLELGSNAFGGSGTITTTNGGTVAVGDNGNPLGGNFLVVSDSNPASANAGGKLTIANGSTLNHHADVILAPATNTHASVLVTGSNSLFQVGGVFRLGNTGGGVADVRVENGGRIAATGNYVSPGNNAGTYTTTVTGANSRLDAANIFVSTLGITSSHQFTVSAGGRAQSTFQVVLGDFQNASGVATVTGTNSTIAVGTTFEVGRNGTGTLNIQAAGKVTAPNGLVGSGATGVGTINLTGSGSLLDVEGDLILGSASGGRGTVNLNPGNPVLVGDAATGTSNLVIADSNLAGNAGGNVRLHNQSNWIMNDVVLVGNGLNTFGRLALNSGSTLSTNSTIDVGSSSTGILDVTSGARVTLQSAGNGTALRFGINGGSGTGTIDGGGSIVEANNNVVIGSLSGTPTSSLTVRNGGRLLVGDKAFGPSSLVGPEGAPLPQVDISDDERDGSEGGIIDIRPGSLLSTDNDVAIGSEFASFGRVNVNGVSGTTPARMTVGTDLIVARGFTVSGTPLQTLGQLNITAGGRVTVGQSMLIASDANANGFVSVTGRTGTIGSSLVVTNTLNVGSQFGAATSTTGTLVISDGGTVTTNDLTINTANSRVRIDAGGTLLIDLQNYGEMTDIRDDIALGYNNGTWADLGITSLTAAGDSRLGIGYIDNAGTLTVRLTLKGDTDLDGAVEFPDLLSLAQNYTQSSRHWYQGDFDYNGVVEFPDLLVLAQNYNQSLSVNASLTRGEDFNADWALAQSLVPEPGTIAVLAGMAVLAGRRRR
jgi:T5SS/PEP-CTERM-associated repeat protein